MARQMGCTRRERSHAGEIDSRQLGGVRNGLPQLEHLRVTIEGIIESSGGRGGPCCSQQGNDRPARISGRSPMKSEFGRRLLRIDAAFGTREFDGLGQTPMELLALAGKDL